MDEAPIGIHPFLFFCLAPTFHFFCHRPFVFYIPDFINMMNSKNWQI